MQPPPSILLDPQDWYCATWRNLPPLKRPEPAPFDREDALARLSKVPANGGYTWNWSRARLAESLSREEAHFWLLAMATATASGGLQGLLRKLEKETCSGEVTRKEVAGWLKRSHHAREPELVLPLAHLFGLDELVELILAVAKHDDYQAMDLIAGFRRYVLPYATPEELAPLRERFRGTCNPAAAATSLFTHDFYFAALLGLSDLVLDLVERWQAADYATAGWYGRGGNAGVYLLLFGLGSPEMVQDQLRRLKHRLETPSHGRAWLAHTEDRALEILQSSIQALKNKAEAEALIRVLGLVRAANVVPPMLELVLKSRDPRTARQWLERHPEVSLPALVPIAQGRSKAAAIAVDLLRGFYHDSRAEEVEALISAQEPAAAARLRAALGVTEAADAPTIGVEEMPLWLQQGLSAVEPANKRAKPWVSARDVPALEVAGRRLSEEQMEAVLRALQASTPEEPHLLVRGLRSQLDRLSLDAFALALFEYWQRDGMPGKQNWVMTTLGLFGSDGAALKLGPLVRTWREGSQHARVQVGLKTLRAIGTDAALMQLFNHLNQPRYESLQKGAREHLEEIAKERGLTMEQLEDHAVSDCGLDATGGRTFDFGPRQFRVVLGPDLKPMVRDADGKVRPDLPKPNSRDDPALADSAVGEWKLLKKLLGEVLKAQAARLEQAMVTERRWSREDWEKLILRHPLMTNLARLLVWGGYSVDGTRTALFRVTEDLTCADVEDAPFDPAPLAQVGIVHPLRMTEAEKTAWGELLGDYEITPPFPQIGRPVHSLAEAERKGVMICRFNTGRVMAASLVGALDRLGWLRGSPGGNALYTEHLRFFYAADLTAVVRYEPGVNMGNPLYSEPQTLEGCFFLRGIQRYVFSYLRNDTVPLAEVDPLVLSEVLADLTRATAAGA